MKCPECGVEVARRALFCHECGTKIIRSDQTARKQNINIINDNKFIIATLCIGFLVAFTIGLYSIHNFTYSPAFGITLAVLSLIMFLYSFAVALLFIYGAWTLLPVNYARTTPAKAAGLMIIPLFNLYWVFQAIYSFSLDFNRYVEEKETENQRLPNNTFLAFSILFVVFPFLIFYFPVFLIAMITLWLLLIYIIHITGKAASKTNLYENKLSDYDEAKHPATKFFLENRFRLYSAVFPAILILIIIIAIALPRPYIVVSELRVLEEIVEGDRPIITATIENRGNARGDYMMTLFIDGEEIETKTTTINANSSTKINFVPKNQYSPGEYITELAIGMLSSRQEDFIKPFKVLRAANLEIKSIIVEPGQIEHIDSAEAKVKVSNSGEVPGTIQLKLFVDDRLDQFKNITVQPESTRMENFLLNIDEPGLYDISANGVSDTLEVFHIERPANGTMIVREMSGGNGRLIITNEYPHLDVLLILVKPDNPQEPLLAAYVHSNSSYTIRGIRDGEYLAYYCYGQDWCTHAKRFTNNVTHGRFTEVSDFSTRHLSDGYYYSIWEADFGIYTTGDPAISEEVLPENFPPLM